MNRALAVLAMLLLCVGSYLAGEPQAPGKPEPEAPAAARPAAFAFTDNPTAAMIPDYPAKGEANGKPIVIRSVLFTPGYDVWTLRLAEKEFGPEDLFMDTQEIVIDLPGTPGVGEFTRKLEYGKGYFQIAKVDAPTETTSWNGDNAWVLQITKWDAKPYNPKGSMVQIAGTASGYVAVVYKAGSDFKNSWVAGRFDGAVVRYWGEPFFARKKK